LVIATESTLASFSISEFILFFGCRISTV